MQFKRKVSNDYFCSKRLSKSFSMVTQRGPRTESSNHSCKHETPEERGDKSYNILSIFLYKIKLKLTKNWQEKFLLEQLRVDDSALVSGQSAKAKVAES